MTATNNLIIDRVRIANAVEAAGLILKNECDKDTKFAAEVLQSQYVEFKVLCDGDFQYETCVVRIADHSVAKPSTECIFDSSNYNDVNDIIAAINKIGANPEAASAAYEDDANDVAAVRKWALGV